MLKADIDTEVADIVEIPPSCTVQDSLIEEVYSNTSIDDLACQQGREVNVGPKIKETTSI